MRLNILFGGPAGSGPNILTRLLGEVLVKQGYGVFYSRDYQSLIRGGHNFNVLTFSNEEIMSNDSKIDLLVALDEKTIEIHKEDLSEGGIVLSGKHQNMFFAGQVFKVLGLEFILLEEELKKLSHFEENLKNAKEGYKLENKSIKLLNTNNKKDNLFINGSQGISIGAIKSGMDIYYSYPMTPATSVLMELGQMQSENNILVLELESEIAVINAGIGSAITGAKVMVGTSGGGFDLMTESLSLAGIAETPLVIYLAQRPGPSTGVATYTSQGDLNLARHSGHGEFPRLVIAPGDPSECESLVSQGFYFSQEFKIPVIIMSDKHLAESFYTINKSSIKITPSKKKTELIRYNSYEKEPINNTATEDAEIIKDNVDKRNEKIKEMKKEIERFETYKVYGNKNSENIIISWGSTKGVILDAMKGLDVEDKNVKFIQVLYLEPFSDKLASEIKNSKNIILIENNSTGQLGDLIAEKTGVIIEDKNKILRYDGRPFLADELRKEIERRLR